MTATTEKAIRDRYSRLVLVGAFALWFCATGYVVAQGEQAKSQVPDRPPGEQGRWELIAELSDEFDGDRLDDKLWYPTNPQWKGRQPGLFAEHNVEVRDGMLHLTARAETLSDLPRGYHTFTTAAVKSKTPVRYGYFEIRAKAMDSIASSAFWFYKNDGKQWTEIDVFEIGGHSPTHEKTLHMNVHVFMTPEDGRKHWSRPKTYESPERLADDFHLYALQWDEKELKFYFDGKLVATQENTHWHQPLDMNFDSETMPEWFGLPDPDRLPQTFSIDYVRSWRKISDQ